MKKILLLSVGLLISCQAQRSSEIKTSESFRTNNIIGGAVAPEMTGVVMFTGAGTCTGALVGLNPPTVITAKHCAQNGATYLNGHFPVKTFFENFPGFKYDFPTQNLPGDLAVLIYSEDTLTGLKIKESDLFTVEPPALVNGTETTICGYGLEGDTVNSPYGNLKCGTNKLVVENAPFAHVDLLKEKLSESAQWMVDTLLQHHELMQKTLVKFGPETTYGITRLALEKPKDPAGEYDLGAAGIMPYRGDSGGPWFIANPGQNPQIFGVSSIVMKMKNETTELVAFAIAWRLDHPWSVKLLEKAASQGADIKGLKELRQSVQE